MVSFVHRLVPERGQLWSPRTTFEQCISDRHTMPTLSRKILSDLGGNFRLQWQGSHQLRGQGWVCFRYYTAQPCQWRIWLHEVMPWHASTRQYLHKLRCEICSGARGPTPLENFPKMAIFGYQLSPMNVWRRQFDIDENETYCVNYKYCLVDAPGVSDFVHRLGEPAVRPAARIEQCAPDCNPVAQLIWGAFDCSGACLGMHKLDNICSSSVYGFVLIDLPLSGARCPTPLQNWSRNGPFSGTFSPMNALWRRQFDIDENESNRNYKYCLVGAPGVSNA